MPPRVLRLASTPLRLAPVALVALVACSEPTPRGRAQLAARIFQAAGITIEAPESLRPAAERAARRWTAGRMAWDRGVPTSVVEPGAAGGGPRVIVGAVDAPGMAAALGRLGIEPGAEGGLRWLGRDFPPLGTALVATLQDPARPGWPLTIVCGADDAPLVERLETLEPVGWTGARVFRRGTLVLELELSREGTPWTSTIVDPEPERRRWMRRLLALKPADDLLLAMPEEEVGQDRAREVLSRNAGALARARLLAGGDEPPARWKLRLFAHPAGIRAVSGELDLAVARPLARTVTALAAEGFPDDGGATLARAVLTARLGPAAHDWLAEGVPVALAGSWWGRPLEEWCAELAVAGAFPGMLELLDPDAVTRLSPHARLPGRALLFRFFRERHGDEYARRWWTGRLERVVDEGDRQAFDMWRGNELAPFVAKVRREREARREAALAAPFRTGVVLDTAPVLGGRLLGAGLEESLERAAGVGANAAQVLATTLEHPGEQRFAARPVARGVGFVEGDVAVAWGLVRARAAGLATLLRPSMLLSDSSSYSGWAKRTTLAEWQDYFRIQERDLLHAALLATLAGAEGLALGAELGDAVRTVPARGGEQREQVLSYKRGRWRDIAGRLRLVFPGMRTYFAAWPADAETFELWGALDRVGVLFWPSLPGTGLEAPTADEARARLGRELARVRALGARVGLPVILGEVGARARSRAFEAPELGPGDVDRAAQRRWLDPLSAWLGGRAGRKGLAGVYLFGWDDGAGDATGFGGFGGGAQGDEALDLVRRMFVGG